MGAHSIVSAAMLLASLAAAPAAVAQSVVFDVAVTQVGIFPIDSTLVTPYLPPGFDPVSFGDSSPMGDDGADCSPTGADCATLQFLVTSFTWAANLARAGETVTMAVVWLYADPPDQYECPPAGPTPPSPYPYMVVPQIVVTSAALAAELNGMGLPAQVGQISQAMLPSPPGSEIWQVDVDDGAAIWHLVTTVPDIPDPPIGPELLRFFGASNGQLLGVVDFFEDPHAHSPLGSSTFALESGTPGFPTPNVEGIGIKTEPGYTMSLSPSSSECGACCSAAGCSILSLADCQSAGGIYLGDGTSCEPPACATSVVRVSWGSLKSAYR